MAICIAGGLFSCSDNEVKSEEKEKTEEVEDKKPKLHLRQMMRLMFADMMGNRERILTDEEELHFGFDYSTLPLAEATDPGNIEHESYQQKLQKFIDLKGQLSETREKIGRARLFNEMKNTCVSCHQEYCIGPLRKIKKIFLIDDVVLGLGEVKQ